MKIISYLATASGGIKHEILKAFAMGCAGEVVKDKKMHPCDIAVMLGFFPNPPDTGNQIFRKQIFENQEKLGKFCTFIDSDIYLNLSKTECVHYRVPFKSIYPGEAVFFNANSPSDRWELICKRKQLNILPWRTTGNHIVLLMQRGKEGWSMTGLDRVKWANQTISNLRKYTDRPIVVRPHPTAVDFNHSELHDPLNRLSFSDSKKTHLFDDLKNSWASIVYSSASSVGSIIAGIPTFVMDSRCMAYDVANHDLANIEEPLITDRNQWFSNSAYALWTIDELRDGSYWRHFIKNFT